MSLHSHNDETDTLISVSSSKVTHAAEWGTSSQDRSEIIKEKTERSNISSRYFSLPFLLTANIVLAQSGSILESTRFYVTLPTLL